MAVGDRVLFAGNGDEPTIKLSPTLSDDRARNDSQGGTPDEPDFYLDSAIGTRRGGRRGRRKAANHRLPADIASGIDTPLSGTPARDRGLDSVDNANELDATLKAAKRMPGRRRAPNPNTSIEADLRRQLSLKTAYRAVTKMLKPVLGELARRTIDEVERNEDFSCKQRSIYTSQGRVGQHPCSKNAAC